MKKTSIFLLCLGLCACSGTLGDLLWSEANAHNCGGFGNAECVEKGYRTDQTMRAVKTVPQLKAEEEERKTLEKVLRACNMDPYSNPNETPLTKCVYDGLCATGKYGCEKFKDFEDFVKQTNANAKKQ